MTDYLDKMIAVSSAISRSADNDLAIETAHGSGAALTIKASRCPDPLCKESGRHASYRSFSATLKSFCPLPEGTVLGL